MTPEREHKMVERALRTIPVDAIWTVTLFIRPVVSAAVETYRLPRTSGRSALLRSAAAPG